MKRPKIFSASRGTLRRASTLGVAGALAIAAVGCSGGGGGGNAGDSQKVVWSTWGSPEELTRYNEFNADFMKRHPDIKVELQPVADYGEYHSKLLTQLTSGTAPDVFYIGDDYIGQFVDSKVLLPLTDKMNSDDSAIKVDDFVPGLFGAADADGQIYAAPNDCNPDALWYDKEALKAAGITEDPATLAADGQWTTAKYLEMNDKLASAGLTGSIFWNYWATHYSWISSQGGTAFDDAGKFVGNTDQTTIDAVDTFGKYFQNGTFKAADEMPEGAGADSVFVSHKAGFFAQGRYTIGTLKSAGVEDSYDIVRWPTPDGTVKPTGVAVSFLAINKDTKAADAAFTFYSEFLSAEGQTFRLQGGGNAVPSIKGADDVVLEGNYPAHAQTFLDMRDSGYEDYPTEAKVPGLSSDVSAEFLKLYTGKATTQETLDAVASLIESKTGS